MATKCEFCFREAEEDSTQCGRHEVAAPKKATRKSSKKAEPEDEA